MQSTTVRVKRFLNDPEELVPEALAGFAAAHADTIRVDERRRVVTRREPMRAGKVGVVAGGGSGHEPLHVGFVGHGMLDAACPGPIFTSPVPEQIVAATRAADGGAGVLHVHKNYTGDVMNFALAAQLAGEEGIPVRTVSTDDDVAVESDDANAGRRGVGGTLVVEKLAGARAEAGGTLDEVAEVARRANARTRSLGVAFSSCVNLASGSACFELGPDEIEVGVGIHGERGRRRDRLRPSAELVADMADTILGDLDVPADGRLLALVNGLGGTSAIELYVVFGDLVRDLESRGLEITRNLVGNYVTSLDMAGAFITLTALDDELLDLWDAPVRTPALRWGDA